MADAYWENLKEIFHAVIALPVDERRYQHAGDFELDLPRQKSDSVELTHQHSVTGSQRSSRKRESVGAQVINRGGLGYCRGRSCCLDARPFDEAGKSDDA
jgi:hypothetical protein